MTRKPKACTLNKRHAWEFHREVIKTTHQGRFASVSAHGLYLCACGERKVGVLPATLNQPHSTTL